MVHSEPQHSHPRGYHLDLESVPTDMGAPRACVRPVLGEKSSPQAGKMPQ